MAARILLICIEIGHKRVRLSDHLLKYRIERELIRRNVGQIVASGASEGLLELEIETRDGQDFQEPVQRMMKEKFSRVTYTLEFEQRRSDS
jgi:hypothetical protein